MVEPKTQFKLGRCGAPELGRDQKGRLPARPFALMSLALQREHEDPRRRARVNYGTTQALAALCKGWFSRRSLQG